MNESGDRLNAAYRALPREEPRASIDAAILAASRRALAKPSASRRWATPVSIAAVLVLAFGVTVHMREEKPGIESPEVYTAPAAAPPPAVAPPPVAAPEAPVPPAKVEKKAKIQAKPDAAGSRSIEVRERSLRDEAAPAPAAPAPAPAPERKDLAAQAAPAESRLAKEADQNRAAAKTATVAAPPQAVARMKLDAPAAAPAPVARAPASFASADAQAPVDEPTRELEAIAKLRAEGRHEEADKALAEFRRKRPDYRIAEAMWERVKPR